MGINENKFMQNNVPDFQSIMYPMLDALKDGQPKTLNEVMDI